jgi:uncharacterized membrane protein
MNYAIVIGTLIVMGVLMIIRWIFQAVFFVIVIFYTAVEGIINLATEFIIYAQKKNDELLTNDKSKVRG